ncbi:thiol:disulfide interchange protein DsbA [Rheinheimera pacifica]|uniref:thiol:disulfide interchange protein DsbA/DsbL n=1 Tax=Rheinheimera pacifica TaxID=173990 RepID=UPI002862F35E|nr:thiol:disulfide interchange protein DsbA/DsbL [Rheinheimera pacifica]MDR6983719.1 thiol:disulfide interchange protein DsbA [Rheinheimera pacifica]
MKQLFLAFTLLLSAGFANANDKFNEGEHYQVLNTAQSANTKVVEFFSYYCPFCYNFEPIVAELKQALPEGISVQKIPVSFHGGKMAPTVQRAHAMAVSLNVEEQFTPLLFTQIHQQRQPPADRAALKALFSKAGVTARQFDANFDSMPVSAMVAEFDQAIEQAAVRSVPSFIINDKYLVNISAVSSQQQFNALVNYLLTLTSEVTAE